MIIFIKFVTLLVLIGATMTFTIELRQEKHWFITIVNVATMIVLGATVLIL